MAKRPFTVLCFLMLAAVSPLRAEVVLLAHATVPGTATDLSGLSSPLESGQKGNLLGGFGSALAFAGGSTFLAVPDRGPNAVPWNPALDDTTSFIPRFHTFRLALQAKPDGALPFTLKPALVSTTLLSSRTPLVYGSGSGLGASAGAPARNDPAAGRYYFSGRSDNAVAGRGSADPANARLDPEGARVSRDGKSVFISDEYGPYVYQFDRKSGARLKTFALPAYFAAATPAPTGEGEASLNDAGRVPNRGMEGLAITPDGATLIGIMQSPLTQDGGKKGVGNRIVTIDIASGKTREYVYPMASRKNGVSEIVAINDHQFLVDERDGAEGEEAVFKRLVAIDLSGATDVGGQARLPESGWVPVVKINPVFLDLLDPRFGLAGKAFPGKIEGLAFGEDVSVRKKDGTARRMHTLYIASDNDFLEGKPSHVYVFGFTDADLPGFVPQRIAPFH
ncbi:esterase-like activity of phytase family protein [Paludibacterium paludis]|uniref:Phytase-like domain-containing protein n=1 Tax=Paludibacterium paludis TaxID=1225769 RepID=A0A918U7K1_9NEIS|nr:esterase-like activity of phytase family protein [Paludibacterium paludis]GGY04918.1 hypothetical protein GCM10011289_04330 [Paludibacterium paludis]